MKPTESKGLNMKLVGYARVSTASQVDGTSLETQIERIEAYCKAYGHELIEVFVEQASGKSTTNRPVFQQALARVKAEADGVIALKLDRIARSTRDVLTLVEDVLKPCGKALVLLDLNVDTNTPTGLAILTVMAAVAELERGVITERTQGGRAAKAQKGGYAYGGPRFGTQAVDGELVPCPSELQIVELIRRHRRSGKSFQAIANYLNDHGYPTKRGGKWGPSTVKAITDRLHQKAS
jgi:DNA invertase Pin-like site-specific DNA recombinase